MSFTTTELKSLSELHLGTLKIPVALVISISEDQKADFTKGNFKLYYCDFELYCGINGVLDRIVSVITRSSSRRGRFKSACIGLLTCFVYNVCNGSQDFPFSSRSAMLPVPDILWLAWISFQIACKGPLDSSFILHLISLSETSASGKLPLTVVGFTAGHA